MPWALFFCGVTLESYTRFLWEAGVVQIRTSPPWFRWASGKESPVYVDHRRLLGYPEWRAWVVQALESRLKALPMTQATARAFLRILFSGASECTLDRQGRVLIPPALREHARLQREAVIIGLSTRAEIWAREEWERYVAEAQTAYNELAEKLVDLGI